jgi:hypothetical protein
MRRNLYHDGHKIDRDDELQMPTIHTIGLTFDYARPETRRPLHRRIPPHRGEDQPLHPHPSQQGRSAQEAGYDPHALPGRRRLHPAVHGNRRGQRHLQRLLRGGQTEQRATEYHKNFKKWVERFQKEDLVGCCAQTDVKGDRMKRPSQQIDPDCTSAWWRGRRTASWSGDPRCITPRPPWPTRSWWFPPAPFCRRKRTGPWPLRSRRLGRGQADRHHPQPARAPVFQAGVHPRGDGFLHHLR